MMAFAVAALSLLSTNAGLLAQDQSVQGGAAGAPADADLGEVRPFTHAKHVPDAWLNPDQRERQRDCRGCHDYSAGSSAGSSAEGGHDPQAVCMSCHFSNETNEYTFKISASEDSFRTSLNALRTQGALFQHSKHLALECRECHEVDGDSISAPILMPKSGGLPLCLECHGGDKPRQSVLRFMGTWRDGSPIPAEYPASAVAKLKLGLVDALNDSPETGANRDGQRYVEEFRHEDHILTEFLGEGSTRAALANPGPADSIRHRGNCGTCHGPMFDAEEGFPASGAQGLFASFDASPSTCGECHISDEARTPLRFEVAAETQLSRTASTFSHSDHLNFQRPSSDIETSARMASDAAYEAIEGEGCSACHSYDADAPGGFTFHGGLNEAQSFRGCQECHAPSPWAPVDHGDWWTHDDHGDWQTCAQCHVFGSENFADERLLANAARKGSLLFRVETQAHPHITLKEGQSIHESCAECHRQPVETLPSRIQEAPFDHASHLPPNPQTADCTGCHGSTVGGALRSLDIGTRVLTPSGVVADATPLQLGLTYDPAACSECHLASAPKWVPSTDGAEDPGDDPSGSTSGRALAAPVRAVPEFSHQAHLGRTLVGGHEVTCVDCHSYSADSNSPSTGIGTLESAMDCTQCHGHSDGEQAGRARLTGGGVTEQEVAACAQCHRSGIPALGAQTEITLAHVVDIADMGHQHHPSDSECSDCHVPREGIIASSLAKTVASTHSRVFAQRTFYSPEEGTRAKPAIHRGGTRKLRSDRVDCFACHWTNTLVDSGDAGSAITNPERELVRNLKGDSLEGFPGGLSAHFDR